MVIIKIRKDTYPVPGTYQYSIKGNLKLLHSVKKNESLYPATASEIVHPMGSIVSYS